MIIGYARVSTKDQKLDLQIDELKKFGCEKIYTDISSGANASRPNFDEMMKMLRNNDTVVVFKLDRLGRSVKHLIELFEFFNKNKITLISLTERVDTSTVQGKLMFNMFAMLAEFERDLIIERTRSGLSAARARGRNGGRPKGLSKEAEALSYVVVQMYNKRELSISQISKTLGISIGSIYNYLKIRGVPVSQYVKKEDKIQQ